MSTLRYEPEVHSACTREEIQKISDDLNFGCSTVMVDALTEIASGHMKIFQELDKMVEFIPEVKYPRTPGYKPEPEDNVGNAWSWRCDIRGAPEGKLAGKKVAIKDTCAVAGVPMSGGSLVLEGYTPEYDATVVTRILEAGGHILGKSTCDDFCMSAKGFSSIDGFAHLPGSPDYMVGGSSGGSAVLVASGHVDMAIGGDQGGSIRIPAAFTGTVGLKPTYGLVPCTGTVGLEPIVDHVGPIARTVHDCALFLEVLAGSDGLDGRQMTNLNVPEYSKLLEPDDINGKKLGILKEGFDVCVETTQKAVMDFLTTVGKAGLETVHVFVPWHSKGGIIQEAFVVQGFSSGLMQNGSSFPHVRGFYSTSLEKAVRQGLHTSANMLGPEITTSLVLGECSRRRYGNHYYTKARNLSIKLSQAYDKALMNCDVLVMPTVVHHAMKFMNEKETPKDSILANIKHNQDLLKNTCPSNVTGHPALTLPLGPLGDGSVDAIMIVGRKFGDLTVLQVARALEKIIPSRMGVF